MKAGLNAKGYYWMIQEGMEKVVVYYDGIWIDLIGDGKAYHVQAKRFNEAKFKGPLKPPK